VAVVSQRASGPVQPITIEPSEEETKQVIELMKQFERTLLDPENQDPLSEFHFGVTVDRVAWDDYPLDVTGSRDPVVAIFMDIHEMSQGRFEEITPEDLHAFLFRGPESKTLANALVMALFVERHRFLHGEDGGGHSALIQDWLIVARDAIYANCNAAAV
jgi:hypothetical protein